MTNPINAVNGTSRFGKTTQAKNQKNDTSIFGSTMNDGLNGQDVCEIGHKKTTSYTDIKEGKNKKGEKTGLFRIRVYEDENASEPKYEDQCFIYKTDKNEKKYKFKTGNANAVDIVTKGNNISVEVSNGNRKLSGRVEKNDDGTFKYDGKSYNSLDEIAVELNHVDLPSKDEADGQINASKQSIITGDCSLLSALNAMSHSQSGREILSKCFVIDDANNTIKVNLPGFNTSFEYDMNEGRETVYHSMGDAEAYYLEKAMNDALDMVKDGKIKLTKDAPSWCKEPKEIKSGNGIHSIEPHQVLYALTGLGGGSRTTIEKDKNGDADPSDVNKAKKVIKECEDNGTTMVAAILAKKGSAAAGNSSQVIVKDAFGETVDIYTGHSYAVKDVSTKTNGKKVVTIIDPMDSSKEITISEDTFIKTFNVLDSVKIKGNNKHPKYYN